ncbi:MAG: urea transporter, partial [Leptospiraceae bacterium]|nr:urea transporter [Leptospiraceae bacterium]
MNLIKLLLEANLKAYSTVLFSSQSLVGFLILLTTFLNPQAGITGLLGAILSNLIAYLLGVH